MRGSSDDPRHGHARRPDRRLSGARTAAQALIAATANLVVLGALAGASWGAGGDPSKVGAYCPLPEKGQKPVCLAPAEAAYGDFFEAVDAGAVSAAEAARVESDLSGASGDAQTYLALSSLSYGYYRLAEEVAASPEADPALSARLAHWNDLLLDLYGGPSTDATLRAAVREAAEDLQARVPSCPASYPGGCTHSEDLVRALAAVDGGASLRSPLSELLERIVGSESDVTRPVSDAQ